MAKLSANTNTTVDGFAGASRHGVFRYSKTGEDHTSYFLHLKTNVPRLSNAMCMIEAVGYAYSTGQSIRCAWTFYPYEGDAVNLYNVGLQSIYPGMIPNSAYISADGFVCISTTQRSLYYVSAVFNCHNTPPSGNPGFNVQITDVATVTVAGNHF